MLQGLSVPRRRSYPSATAVPTTSLETVLLPEDIESKLHLCCLACRRRLATLVASKRAIADEEGTTSLSITLVPSGVRDFQQSKRGLAVVCACGCRSVYHLL